MIVYHGTNDAESVLAGVCLDIPRRRDPGDFGWGFYCAFDRDRAAAHGRHVLVVDVDESALARIPNPYFLDLLDQLLPETSQEHLLYGLIFDEPGGLMLTVRGDRRDETARQVTEAFLQAGWKGIVADSPLIAELVVFDPSAIRSIELEAA